MSENFNRVWRPLVEPNQTELPQPGTLTNNTQQEFYTTTSLVSSEHQPGFNEFKQLKQLNNEIISACQAFNSSPKPFSRQESSQSSILQPIPSCVQEKQNLNIGKELFQQKQIPNRASLFITNPNSSQQDQQQENSKLERRQEDHCQEENMAPKLVHKQYNSPLDLYSMNNIRKTIEAHTELIAPGLKGINFMKPEAPVNKQSEVYKLVMEEEERARSQQGSSSRLSPISGQPLSIPTGMVDKSQLRQVQAHAKQPTTTKVANQSYTSNLTEMVDREVNYQRRSEGGLTNEINRQQPIRSNNAPVCCECGQFIHSTFARIQNKFIHPQCFNCTTCGTSLKNTGYFTINEKLYCDIHAKQVANLMNIKYDFDQQKSKILINQQQTISGQSNQTVCQSQQQQNLIRQQEQRQAYLATLSNQEMVNKQQDQQQQQQHDHRLQQQQRSFTSVSSSPATISTMFADRSCSNTSGINDERQEIRWTWRPATSKDQTSSSTSSQIYKQTYSNSASQHEQSSPQIIPTSYGANLSTQSISQQQQQSTMSLGTRGRGLLRESSATQGGRIPICVHCHLQIQGPYILAGKTTWCKTCSQSNFNCSSCRRSLLDIGFIEDNAHKYYCESCFEAYYAPICSKCNIRIKGDCLNALGKQWHPSCFVCGHCRRPFGNSSFYLEDNLPYCERDWNVLFTTKCYSCSYPIEAGDKWIEALDRNYHSNCFRCSSCQTNLEGSTFYCKNGKPYCRLHAR